MVENGRLFVVILKGVKFVRARVGRGKDNSFAKSERENVLSFYARAENIFK